MIQLALLCAILLALAFPLGAYLAWIYGRARLPGERLIYRLLGVRADVEMTWSAYAMAVLWFSLAGVAIVYALQRLQPGMPAVSPGIAFNTAVSFVTNTNWQAYAGESTLSPMTQAVGLAVQNFVSAAVGMAVLVALVRGFSRREYATIGNFWVDLTRGILYILLPLSLGFALYLVWTGVPQTLDAHAHGLVLGPVASQIAIKMLGTNGGGYYNANGAHPFENPTATCNFIQTVAILLLAAALCIAFGKLVRAKRQGVALLAAMFALFIPLAALTIHAEATGNPRIAEIGENLEGKEVRFGAPATALWAAATTAASNGSVDGAMDSLSPLGALGPLWMIQLGEVVFGGVGSGLYGMVLFAIVAVFLAGLMIGRTPELLGKKIEAFEMKMAAIGILAPSVCILLGTAIAVGATSPGLANPHGPHAFTEILYGFSSASGNNGSAFGGLAADSTFLTAALGICMWLGRFVPMLAVLAVAGSLAKKKSIPPSSGTLPTDGPLFVVLLVGVVVLVGALTFLPALGLGPIAEHLAR